MAPFLLVNSRKQLQAVDHEGWQRTERRSKAARATVTPVLATWTANRRDGLGREVAPHLTRSEDCQGQGRGERDELAPRAAAAEYFPLTPEAGGRLAARGRPTPLVEVRPQERIQQHTVEHITGFSPFVQILDVPGLQMVDQPVEVLKMLDTVTSEQVIAVPKISASSRCLRTVLLEPQMAEQLVEVPADVVARFRLLEPITDIPALRGPFGTGGLQVSSQHRVLLRLSSRSSTYQFPFVVFLVIFKVFTHDRVQQRVRHSCSRFQKWRSVIDKIQWQFWDGFGPFFRTLPRGVSPGVRGFFEPLDGEEFFVIEGSQGWRVAGSLPPKWPATRKLVLGLIALLMSCDHTRSSKCVSNNNNSDNTVWRRSVLTGEEPPPHSGELKHALSQEGGPTQYQLSRLVSSRHHISMEHRQRRKHLLLNHNTKARSGICSEKKKETHFPRKNWELKKWKK